MFVATHPWQKDADYKKLIRDLEPPAPPGSDEVWELHFCKWWGWNWVKRKDMAQELKKTCPSKDLQSKTPEKKPIRNLCQTLCFKKKKEQQPLQHMYNTPSNSMIQPCGKKPQTSFQSFNPSCCTIQKEEVKVKKSISLCKTSSNVISHIKSICNQPEVVQKVTNVKEEKKKVMTTGSSSISSEECGCFCNQKKLSSEESIEYINIKCCPCCHPKEPSPPPPKIVTDEKCTQGTPCPGVMMATQTEPKEKKRRRKRICVVCCCCGQNCRPCSCTCTSNKTKETVSSETKESATVESAPKPVVCCCCGQNCRSCTCTCTSRKTKETTTAEYAPKPTTGVSFDKKNVCGCKASINQPVVATATKSSKETTNLDRKFEPLYVTGMPIDTMLYNSKSLVKYGIPSRNYSWIHATKSDIWDQFSHLKLNYGLSDPVPKTYNKPTLKRKCNVWETFPHLGINGEYSSPLTGKTYNLSPIEINDLEAERTKLFEPLSADEEIQSLKRIESDLRMDTKSRIMLDVVCDAILKKDKEHETDFFLKDFIYPSTNNETERNTNYTYNLEPKSTSSKLNQTILDDEVMKRNTDILNRSHIVNSRAGATGLSTNLNYPKTFSDIDIPRESQSPTDSIENRVRRLLNTSFKENENTSKLLDYTVKQDYLTLTDKQPPTRTTRLMLTPKRRASPICQIRDNKKVKLQEPSTATNSNVSDIFQKIDEIVMRSRVNNSEIQNVLNNIPNKTFDFFTSWDVPKSRGLPLLHQGQSSSLNVDTVTKDLQEITCKTKLSQNKIQKVSRPSLIPKRIVESKICRKNVS